MAAEDNDPGEAFEREWTRCAPWIEAALDHAGSAHGIEDVKALVERRECRFWAWPNCACVTEAQIWPKAKWLLIWLAGGDLNELLTDVLPQIEAYAVEEGCSRVWLVGRPGWERVMPTYKRAAVTLMKELV
jgi:hypothetical protein